MLNKVETNNATLCGTIVGEFEFSHKAYDEGFYRVKLAVRRLSGQEDLIPITVSDRLVNVKESLGGTGVKISGQVRTFNRYEGEKHHLDVSVFARELEICEEGKREENLVSLDGFLCKRPVYRETPLGREIADIVLAVNRPYGKSDYIPCICWGRNAGFASGLEVGTHLRVRGRIQSREYIKKLSETECEKRMAYEVSLSRMEEVKEDGQEQD